MDSEYLQIVKVVEMAATGQPGDIQTIQLEASVPYQRLAMYLQGEAAAVTAQPLFGGANDGAATNVAGEIHQKIYQQTAGELRPATQGKEFAGTGVVPLKSELRLTNTDAAPAKLTVMLVAATASGGA